MLDVSQGIGYAIREAKGTTMELGKAQGSEELRKAWRAAFEAWHAAAPGAQAWAAYRVYIEAGKAYMASSQKGA